MLMALTGAMLTYEVIARYFFVRPTVWAAEISQLFLIWGCLLAMAWVLQLRRHITVNAVTNLLPLRAQVACTAISLICLIVFSGIVTVWGFDIFYDSFVRGRTTGSILNWPIWFKEVSVPIGFGLLTLQALADLIALPRSGTRTLGSSHE